ncbi:hypothetical protein GGD41_003925 [Paraburkholderia bryophila]|uniref:Uncharacterized protein n=1 Tax=Paraburkholderia bryophila TaxID=420952 RepID=A0A7Y9W9Z4_9BURK|nr:hypothetical protein [Paraburkholderia bryophila]
MMAIRQRRLGIDRQPQREHTALTDFAGHGDPAAQQTREFTRDRQPKTATAVLSAGGTVGLLERFEDHLQLVRRNANAGIAHVDTQQVVRRRRDRQRHFAPLGELHRVRQQIAQNLRDALTVGDKGIGRTRRTFEVEPQLFGGRQRLEHFFQRLQRRVDRHRFEFDRDLTGFDLRQIENVVDQHQQIAIRRMNRFRIAHLLVAQIAGAVLLQQLGENQRTVQRRAQFVRHVGEKLGLVTARLFEAFRVGREVVLCAQQIRLLPFETLRVFFELHVGLFEFGLLRFEPHLRFHQRAAALFEALVRDAQLFLLHLQLFVQLLRFGQRVLQPFAIQRGFDEVAQRVADQLHELLIAHGQLANKAQFDDAVHLPVVDDRHDEKIFWRALAGSRHDLHVVVRQVAQDQRAARGGRLPDQRFALFEIARAALFAFAAEPIRGDAAQRAVLPVTNVERADDSVQILGEKVEHRAAHQLRGCLTDHLLGQQALPRA